VRRWPTRSSVQPSRSVSLRRAGSQDGLSIQCIRQEITMGMTVRRDVASYDFTLRIDSIALGGDCTRDINRNEPTSCHTKPCCFPVFTVVETNDVTLCAYAGDPGEVGIRKVYSREFSPTKPIVLIDLFPTQHRWQPTPVPKIGSEITELMALESLDEEEPQR
jgi:hypothetical protein